MSSLGHECAALALLCTQQGWIVSECNSVRAARRLIQRTSPRVVLTRYHLPDGHADDIIATLTKQATLAATRVIVLAPSGVSSSMEARQLRLGAHCVLRDPIRTEVLLAYVEKFVAAVDRKPTARGRMEMEFIGATLTPDDRTLKAGDRAVMLTPREALLAEILAMHADQVVSYELLYSEVLGRKFHGDTSNMRVLLAKLDASTRQLGLSVRDATRVIPKTGYKYSRNRMDSSMSPASMTSVPLTEK